MFVIFVTKVYLLIVNQIIDVLFVWQLGEKKSGINIPGKVQDFFELRDQCLRDGVLFEDDSFPANDSSFYMTSGRGRKSFQWVRPSELVDSPLFISDGLFDYQLIYLIQIFL